MANLPISGGFLLSKTWDGNIAIRKQTENFSKVLREKSLEKMLIGALRVTGIWVLFSVLWETLQTRIAGSSEEKPARFVPLSRVVSQVCRSQLNFRS